MTKKRRKTGGIWYGNDIDGTAAAHDEDGYVEDESDLIKLERTFFDNAKYGGKKAWEQTKTAGT